MSYESGRRVDVLHSRRLAAWLNALLPMSVAAQARLWRCLRGAARMKAGGTRIKGGRAHGGYMAAIARERRVIRRRNRRGRESGVVCVHLEAAKHARRRCWCLWRRRPMWWLA